MSSSSIRASTAFITFTISFAVYTDQFLYAAVVPFLPYVLDVPAKWTQYWTAVLLAMFGVGCFVSSIPWGVYTDALTSRRVPFLLGLAILLAATGILWAAPLTSHAASLPLQILARLMQGFASTVVWTTGLAVLVDEVGKGRIGEYSGYIGIALNAGNITAPLLGGMVYEKCGYHPVFGLIIGVVVLDIVFRLIMRENRREHAPSSTELLQSSAPSRGEVTTPAPDDTLVAETTVAVVSSRSSIHTTTTPSTTAPRPCTPAIIRLLPSPRFLAALWSIFILATIFSGFEAVLPIFVSSKFTWTSEGGGVIFLPLSLPALLGPLIGKYTDHLGGRWFGTVAFLLLCPLLVLLRFVTHNSVVQKVTLFVLLSLIGGCLAIILEPMFAEVCARATELESEDMGKGWTNNGYYAQAYAHFNMAWALGNTAGPFLAGFVVDYAGWPTATWSLRLIAGVSAIPVALFCDGPIWAR